MVLLKINFVKFLFTLTLFIVVDCVVCFVLKQDVVCISGYFLTLCIYLVFF